MQKEVISTKQGITIMTLYLFGSTLVLGAGKGAKQNAWIAVLLGALMAIPIIVVYIRLLKFSPGKNLLDVFIEKFGKYIGKFLILLYCWYAIHLGALILRNFSEFIHIVALESTPQCIIAISMGLLCIYMIQSGVEVMGRWGEFVFPLIIFTLLLTFIFAIKDMELNNIMPILENGIKPLITPAYGIFSFPFAETVLFIFILDSLKKPVHIGRVYFISIGIALFFFLLATFRNTLILDSLTIYYAFPSFTTIRILNVGTLIQRVEVTIAIIFLIAGIVKFSVCLLVASKGLAKIFNFDDFHPIIAPVAFLILTLSSIIYASFNEMLEWLEVYPYYASLFQVTLPIMILIYFEVLKRIEKKKKMSN